MGWLLSLGLVCSSFDSMVFYMRRNAQHRWSTEAVPILTGELIGMVTGHVDDLGVTGTKEFRDFLHTSAEKRWGPVRRVGGEFLHVCLLYKNLPNFEKSADLCDYVAEIKFVEEPKGPRT